MERRSARVKPCPLFNMTFHLEIRHSTGEKSRGGSAKNRQLAAGSSCHWQQEVAAVDS